ncbi:sensor histidine kinase [Streptomyces sp. NBC_01456]|uniref:sensor histidine kinase n=1 Tax=unclassified Streptomyces TaxID=2593676 RepID=UPI002E2FB96F|nr:MULTISPECIES: sensor histidine kinase [unclassified Streptomyces]
MVTGGGKSGEPRLRAVLLAVPRTLRDDLWTAAADPLPRMRGPRLLARLPHVVIGVLVYATAVLNTDFLAHVYGLEMGLALLLSLCQSLALFAAMFRPIPAWWVSTAAMVVAARAAGNGLPGPEGFPWTEPGLLVQAATVFLLALRVRPRVAAEALGLHVLAGLCCLTFLGPGHHENVTQAVPLLIIATVLGAALRGRRVARTQLVEQEELTAEERARRTLLEERHRIARELHDVVAHHMSVISIQAQVAPHLVADPTDELKENLAGIRTNAVDALRELRRVLGVLRSEDPAAEGVRHAPQPTLDRLDELLDNVRAAGLAVTTESTGEPHALSPGAELSAFRIVQEALSNAMRHAPGAAVRVRLGYAPDGLTLHVTNTAPAGPAPPSPGSGHGLLGMRERTAMLGGELAAGPTPDGGYEVAALLPAPARQPAETGEDTP